MKYDPDTLHCRLLRAMEDYPKDTDSIIEVADLPT